jgi:hypothetical protein
MMKNKVADRLGRHPEPSLPEGRYDNRDAYQRDYDNSVAGMGKRQSYAYSQDGGANDEGWNNYKEPEPKRKIYSLQINGKTWTQDGNTVTFFTRERAESAKNSILNKRPETKIVVMVQEV